MAAVSPTKRTKRLHAPPGAAKAESHNVTESKDRLGKLLFWCSTPGGLLLLAISLLLQSLIFAPISIWPLTFVCLVPWLVFLGTARVASRVYWYSYVLGLVFHLINMRWLYPATGWGYLGLSLYQAVYFPLLACPIRHGIRRRGVPLALTFACIWTGGELLRAVVLSGFPWFFLSHSLYKVLTLIQLSDCTGAYGVSFLAAAVNGTIADHLLARMGQAGTERPLRLAVRARRSTGLALAVMVLAVLYGQIQLRRGTGGQGPRVAVLQGDYISSIDGDEVGDGPKRKAYMEMLEAAAKEMPDLILLPETPWIVYLNPEARNGRWAWRESFQSLQSAATRHQTCVVTGAAAAIPTPHDVRTRERQYNSAYVFRPEGTEPERYDKVHVVPFGEAVPFRFGRLRFLYLWINRIMPFSGPDGLDEYSLFPGEEFRVFSLRPKSIPERDLRFGVPICYEDVMPYVSREFTGGGSTNKRADFLLNISNDGWFGRGIQQPQHLAICVFRAVENRVGIARAVNTGISGFIEPTGRVHDLVRADPQKRWSGNSGYAVARVGIDSRYTVYSRYGDWFGWLCSLVWLAAYVDYWISRFRNKGDLDPTEA